MAFDVIVEKRAIRRIGAGRDALPLAFFERALERPAMLNRLVQERHQTGAPAAPAMHDGGTGAFAAERL